jgi:hypothetical protein
MVGGSGGVLVVGAGATAGVASRGSGCCSGCCVCADTALWLQCGFAATSAAVPRLCWSAPAAAAAPALPNAATWCLASCSWCCVVVVAAAGSRERCARSGVTCGPDMCTPPRGRWTDSATSPTAAASAPSSTWYVGWVGFVPVPVLSRLQTFSSQGRQGCTHTHTHACRTRTHAVTHSHQSQALLTLTLTLSIPHSISLFPLSLFPLSFSAHTHSLTHSLAHSLSPTHTRLTD